MMSFLCEVIRYGTCNKQEMVGQLASLYRTLTTKVSEEARYAVHRHVVGFVENTSVVSINAFLPFIAEENSQMIVSTAVLITTNLGMREAENFFREPRSGRNALSK
jgi:hypothetical protein